MIGTKQFCALLLAGGMGAGSVVTVQQVRPGISKARAPAAKPRVQRAAQHAPQPARITECPTIAPLGPGIGALVPLQTADPAFGPILPAGGDGGFGGGGSRGGFGPTVQPDPVLVAPGIPQPDTWVMLVAGFGFLGVALRRRRGEEGQRNGLCDERADTGAG
jgi:hypothetical protein